LSESPQTCQFIRLLAEDLQLLDVSSMDMETAKLAPAKSPLEGDLKQQAKGFLDLPGGKWRPVN
jgi:hypothetical protein